MANDEKIGDAANGQKSPLDGTEKLPTTGSQWFYTATLKTYIGFPAYSSDSSTFLDGTGAWGVPVTQEHTHADSDHAGAVAHSVLSGAGTSLHVPAYSSDSTTYLNGAGEWTTPPGTGGITYSSDSTEYLNGKGEFTVPPGGGGGGTSSLHSIDDPTDTYWSGGDLGFDLEFDTNTSSLPSGVGWVNQDSSTYSERGGAGTLARASQAGDHNYLLTRSLSGAPSTWLMTAEFSIVGGAGNYLDGGLVLRESGSGKFMSLVLRNFATSVIFKWDAPTTFNSAPVTLATPTLPVIYFRIRKNSGSSFDFEVSYDGLSWRTVTSAYNVGAYITPDEYGFEMLNGSGEAAGVSCHWIRLR